ncbi:metallophosphoesterase [Bacillus sp. M6-12]|uniref:metallophosphoesterase n=1 Tax=Bacillus sp. M6-12 TaxID=2054166 RepID=UPI000C76FA67|nr:metallophosphoesterase [Bacillus sp. M6-12]PLS19735.1 metallophosphoesterase [Bacillus sp. M6-12]
MKFLYFGDKHYRVTAPENRLDDFRETMKRKTMEIIELGKKHKVSAFLQPGDFFDTPNPPLDYVAEVMEMWSGIDIFDILSKLTSGEPYDQEEVLKSLKNYTPLIGVAGNHELFGNNLKTLPKTTIGFINKIGLMKFATKENPFYFFTEDGLKIAVTGTHYHLDIDSPEYISDYVVEEKLGDFHIHMVHGYLTDKSKGELFRHTLVDQIKHTKADLTITGHDHIGFPITEVDGKYFVNPGAIPRLSNDLKEINRKVKVLLIDITKEHGLQLKEIPLKSAVDGNMVLNRTKIVERKKKEARLEEFKKAVREAGVKKATDINEIIRDLADNRKLPVSIKDKVVQRVSEKMATMKAVDDGVVKEAYVTKIILENFQSHEFTELDFSDGFNVFVGESKQGKTSVLRAFDWIYENKPAGKRIIRIGADYARVTIYLSNGYIISRYIEAKRGGKNGYEVTDPNTGEVEFNNTKILPEIQKLLGFTQLNIDKDLQFNLNFLKQGTGWFMIGDQYSSPQKAKMIGGIYGTQYADAVIRDIDSENKRSNEKIKTANEVLAKTDSRLKEFDYLPDLKKSIDFIEKMVKEIEELKVKKEKIETLLTKREKLVENISENDKALEALKDLDKVYYLLSQTKEQETKRNRLEELLDKHKKTSFSLKHLYHSLDSLKHLDQAKDQLRLTHESINKRNAIEKVVFKREEIIKQIQQEQNIISKTEEVTKAKRLVDNLNKGFDKRNAIEQSILKRENILKSIDTQNQLLKRTEQMDKASSLLHEIHEKVNVKKEMTLKVKRAEELEVKRDKNNKSLRAIRLTLEKTENVDTLKAQFETLKEVLTRKEQIEKVLSSRDKMVQSIQNEDKAIKESNNKILKDIQLYQEALERAGKCPVCFGTVDKATINRIVQEYVKDE